jgi:hypothetical protein
MPLGSNTSGHIFDTTFTSEGVLYSDSSGVITSTSAGSSGQILQSTGNATPPAYSTATFPTTAGTSGNVLTSDGTNFTSAAPVGGLLVVSGNLTNAQIKALHGTPVQVVAAPGLGKYVQILHAVMTLNYGGNNAFVNTGGSQIFLYFGTTQQIVGSLGLSQIVATSSQVDFTYAASNLGFASTSAVNLAVNFWNASATEISGNAANDNTMSYNVVYRIVTIP